MVLKLYRIQDMVKYVTNSLSSMQHFIEIAQTIRLATGKGLILYLSTRWNATHAMLQSALSTRMCFCNNSQVHYHCEDSPTEDWKMLWS